MFWLDYMGTLQEVKKGGHGYAGYFTSSVLDNDYKKDMTLEEGIECIKKCISEMKTRFLISQPAYVVKIVTKDGTQVETIE